LKTEAASNKLFGSEVAEVQVTAVVGLPCQWKPGQSSQLAVPAGLSYSDRLLVVNYKLSRVAQVEIEAALDCLDGSGDQRCF
jgi:hypothetical protein